MDQAVNSKSVSITMIPKEEGSLTIFESDFSNLFFITSSDILTQDLRKRVEEIKKVQPVH